MSKKRPVGRPPKKRTKAETYKIRYQVLRNLGYTAKEARYFRSRKMDVSLFKINPKTGKVVKGKVYKKIIDTYPNPKTMADNFVKYAWEVDMDRTKSRWGMLTHDKRYRDKTAYTAKFIEKRHKISTDQSYYFLYIMTKYKRSYTDAQTELLSSRDFEEYVSKGGKRGNKSEST